MKQLPWLLIYSRMVIAIVIGAIALINPTGASVLIVVLMSIGLITDILDGIIARKLGVATQQLRMWDSNTDQFFWIVTLASIFSRNVSFIADHYLPILLIGLLEALAYLLSYARFRRTVATHSWLAKVWTLTLFAFLVDLTLHSQSSGWFGIAVVLGIISRLEILFIIGLMKEWTTDVSSVLWIGKVKKEGN